MFYNLEIVNIDEEYCNYLRQYDSKVTYNFGEKKNRPYVGVLFNIENMEYFVPLSSPKQKHLTMKNTLDFFKLDNGKLGAINLNNMIPVTRNNYNLVDFDKKNKSNSDIKYLLLLENQLSYLNANYFSIINKAIKLYYLYNEDRLPNNIKDRCCNYPLLEEKCNEYNTNKELQEV